MYNTVRSGLKFNFQNQYPKILFILYVFLVNYIGQRTSIGSIHLFLVSK